MMNQDVLNYINENSIYGIYRLEKEGLSERRINHCIEVATISKQIASAHSEDFHIKAYVAGLYQDIAQAIPLDYQTHYSQALLNYKA